MLSISVENLSKRYQLGMIDRKVLWREVAWLFKGGKNRIASPEEATNEFWALSDVSFEIQEGETVGFIGANGAGKSTLLKILSRITSPTSGTVRISGRVGSLLEVGTGFNPEMTGRENVYLNGAIQGMKRPEIDAKFDNVVSFAGVEKFIDTPVKRYSSGMYVRLAFSVAAFLESEILIVDEVLSVGDQQFQNRCIQRLQDIIKDGRTVLFVSHGAGQVRRLCSRAICLKNGKIICDDEPMVALSHYQNSIHESGGSWNSSGAAGVSNGAKSEVIFPAGGQPGDSIVKILACRVTDSQGEPLVSVSSSQPIRFEMDFEVTEPGEHLRPAAYLSDELGNILFWTCDTNRDFIREPMKPGSYRTFFTVPGDFLMPGVVIFSAGIGEANESGLSHALAYDVIRVEVGDDTSATSVRGAYTGILPGVVRPRLPWKTVLSETKAASRNFLHN